METVTEADLRNMKPLRAANDTIGDPAATQAMLGEDGYLFFQNVLDPGAVDCLKRKYMDVLVDMGLVDPGQDEPIWNGADLTDFPVKIEPLHDMKVWESFVAEPAIEAFFTRLLGAQPFWLPIVEYRVTPPASAFPDDPFIGRHQDGFYNMGMECLTCWVPLMEIDERIGGLAVVPGLHHAEGYLHELGEAPFFRIPPGALANNNWHRSHYRPGDLVMFDKVTPHSGLPNRSDRFRLSMDVRVAPITGELPVLGEILDFTDEAISVRDFTGNVVALAIDEDTYCRWTAGKRISTAELRALLPVGERVLASAREGIAISLRPPR